MRRLERFYLMNSRDVMKRTPTPFALLILLLALQGVAAAQRKPSGAKPAAKSGVSKPPAQKPQSDEASGAELDEIAKLDAAERVERLQAFVKEHPKSASLQHAQELLTSARAALGDEKLRAGDHAAGIELFRAAVADAPAGMSDELSTGSSRACPRTSTCSASATRPSSLRARSRRAPPGTQSAFCRSRPSTCTSSSPTRPRASRRMPSR